MSSIVATALASHAVPAEAKTALAVATDRHSLAEHQHDLLSAAVDLKTRVLCLEHPGATPALVALAAQLDALQTDLAIAQAEEKLKPGSQAVQIQLIQGQITAAVASAPAAAAARPDPSSVEKILVSLLAAVKPADSPTPPVSG